jgi:NADPH-dependent ferric siderophore reductase
MLTLPHPLVKDARPSYRPFRATVKRVVTTSPSFRRVTFTGPDFATFGTDGHDQRVKIVFPVDGGFGGVQWDDEQLIASGSWYQEWRALPDDQRAPFRTYTIRAVRAEAREVDIDFVVHGDGGPAARWILAAQEGDDVVIVGPDAQSVNSMVGLDWRPGEATSYLLAGDETAAPAICSILESLPAGTRAAAFIEVPHERDAPAITVAAEVDLQWIARDAGPLRLDDAVRDWLGTNAATIAPALSDRTQVLDDIDVDVEMLWDSPEAARGQFYAWLAGESAVIKSLRRLLVSETGIDRTRVAFMGYWRLGKSEAQ